jgi:glycosyltransferase involved in cell wall biosynthesis
MFLPLRELDRHDGYEVTFAAAGDTGGEAPIITGRMLEGHDVIVGQRLNNHKGLDIWRRARTPYSRLVLDLDDDVFNVGPENFNAYNLYNRADIQDATIHHAETSDLVTVSTEPLAEVMREYSGNVAVLPNHIPSWVLDLPRQRRDRPRVGWGGGASHGLDIAITAEPVTGFLKRFPGWDLQLNGTDYRHTFAYEGAPADRMTSPPWVRISDDAEGFYSAIDFDVGLCPLNPTTFARSKSALKALEMNGRGIPVLASDCEAYRPYVKDGVNGFLISKPRQWLERLCDLAADEGLREKMSAQARICAKEYLIESGFTMWRDAYSGLFRDRRP